MRNSTDFNAGQFMPTIHSAEEAVPTHSSENNIAAAAGANAGLPNIAEAAQAAAIGGLSAAGAYGVNIPPPGEGLPVIEISGSRSGHPIPYGICLCDN